MIPPRTQPSGSNYFQTHNGHAAIGDGMKRDNFYWVYNLPLQVWFDEESDDARIVNYMPRKESCCDIQLSEVIGEQSKEDFFNQAAFYFDNLAKLMRAAANGSRENIYYHDQGIEKDD